MTHAYDTEYLDDAMRNLGEAVDYAVNACRLKADDFMGMFIVSSLAVQFEKGVPRVISGMSGTELVWETLQQSGVRKKMPEPQIDYEYSPAYWCGWILA